MRRVLFVTVYGVTTAGAVPNIPLVKREPQFFRGALATLHVVTDGYRFRDLAIHGQIHCEIFRAVGARFLLRISDITV